MSLFSLDQIDGDDLLPFQIEEITQDKIEQMTDEEYSRFLAGFVEYEV